MDNNKTDYSGRTFLYDPMFDPKMKAAAVKRATNTKIKVLFVLIILLFICFSLFFSFHSISQDKFEYKTLDDGRIRLELFSGKEKDTVLFADYLRDKNGENPDSSKPVSVIKEYAVSTNEYLQFIVIGSGVTDLDARSFYSCKNLLGIIVDKNNPNFTVLDGVLYKVENGVPVKSVLCPAKLSYALCAESILGVNIPERAEDIKEYQSLIEKNREQIDAAYDNEDEEKLFCYDVSLPDTVNEIGQLSFCYCDRLRSISLHEGITQIGHMTFMKCERLENTRLPDTLEIIGSDAFSYCKKIDNIFIPASVKKIGHHAFFETSASEVLMELSEDEVKARVDLGDSWTPKHRKGVMVSVPIFYSQERSDA